MPEPVIGTCPSCESDVTLADMNEDFQKLAMLCGMLLTHAAMIDMLSAMPEYVAVKEGFLARMAEMIETMQQWCFDLQMFGEAFDEPYPADDDDPRGPEE